MENWTVQKIEHYLDGELSVLESQALEADLKQNPELRQTVDHHHLVREAIDLMAREKLADIYGSVQKQPSWLSRQAEAWSANLSMLLRRVKKEIFFSGSGPLSGNFRPVWVLQRAMLVAGVLLPFLFALNWYTDRYYSDAVILSETYRPEQAVILMGDDSQAFRDGFNAYQKGDFPGAIKFFQAIAPTDSMYLTASFYLGHSYLKVGDYTAAMSVFERVAKEPASPFAQNAEWNRVLAMLGRGMSDNPVFRAELNRIADDARHNYRDDARQLRKKLDSVLRKFFL